MKRFLEPITGIILGFLSWEAWTDILLSLFVAFMGGAMAYLGKWLATMVLRSVTKRKNVFISKIREAMNTRNSPDDDLIF
jgi:hypothetical protein